MIKRCVFLLALVSVSLVLGCASTADNLQRETARFIGDVAPQAVSVVNIDRGMTSVSWDATSPKGNYACSADDMVRRVHCVRK
jgi:hypothetical protein